MRNEYPEFVERGAEILDVGPDDADAFRKYWKEHGIPFPGLADPDHHVAKLYDQPWRLLKLGRMPMQLVIDRAGIIRYRHDGTSMKDIPKGSALLAELDRIA